MIFEISKTDENEYFDENKVSKIDDVENLIYKNKFLVSEKSNFAIPEIKV